jgi:hypothetical protein
MLPCHAVASSGLYRKVAFYLAVLSGALAVLAPAAEPKSLDWPFIARTNVEVPAVKQADWVRNPIDAFILTKLERKGLRPNPPADKATLLRRVTFDLTGLAPTPAELDAFLADRSPDAYERVVDRLLAAPRFGERWAQHWLDVVRYAETEGFKLERWRPEAYRYRDYVIRAFNSDLPFDRFVRQQLAGDELEPDNPDALIATGLLRLYPEESNGANYKQIRQEILDDVTDVFGATFLGMTFGCARCHDHKFDPITQKDYYRLQAFFVPMVQRDLPLVSKQEQARYEHQLAVWKGATQSIRTEIDSLLDPLRRQLNEESVQVFDPVTQAALRTAPEQRTPLQRQIAALASKQIDRKLMRVHRRLVPTQRARYDELQKKLAAFDAIKPPAIPVAMAVSDVGPEAPATFRLANGNYQRPREEVRPAFPEFLTAELPAIRPPAGQPHSTGRRAALAAWLTRPDHPLTACVAVNRLWQHHFGAGIVATPNDFGARGEQATHPALLDYLAARFVQDGWSLKQLHRLMVTSATYLQSSALEQNSTAVAAARVDPENHLLWHARVRRRDAESIRDVTLQASGQMNWCMFGPSAQPDLPKPLMESRYAWYPNERPEERDRRSVYVYACRNLQVPLFSAFDVPDRFNSCPTRAITTTAPQALVMLNGQFSIEQAQHMGAMLVKQHGSDVRALIRHAYLNVYSRPPSRDEVSAAEEFLAQQARRIAAAKGPDAAAAAVADFCHALMNAAEFLYVE